MKYEANGETAEIDSLFIFTWYSTVDKRSERAIRIIVKKYYIIAMANRLSVLNCSNGNIAFNVYFYVRYVNIKRYYFYRLVGWLAQVNSGKYV